MSLPHRPSLHPAGGSGISASSSSSLGSSAAQAQRQRQYAHLAAQLATLHAHLADLENLVRMTSVQAQDVRGLGGYMGSLFMASSKILGDENLAEGPGAEEAREALRKAEQCLRASGNGGRLRDTNREGDEEGRAAISTATE